MARACADDPGAVTLWRQGLEGADELRLRSDTCEVLPSAVLRECERVRRFPPEVFWEDPPDRAPFWDLADLAVAWWSLSLDLLHRAQKLRWVSL